MVSAAPKTDGLMSCVTSNDRGNVMWCAGLARLWAYQT